MRMFPHTTLDPFFITGVAAASAAVIIAAIIIIKERRPWPRPFYLLRWLRFHRHSFLLHRRGLAFIGANLTPLSGVPFYHYYDACCRKSWDGQFLIYGRLEGDLARGGDK